MISANLLELSGNHSRLSKFISLADGIYSQAADNEAAISRFAKALTELAKALVLQ
jgi:hypothetical protein